MQVQKYCCKFFPQFVPQLFFFSTLSCCVPISSHATKYPGAWNMPGVMYEGSHNMPSIMYIMYVSCSTDCIINYGEI